jgi:phospholipid/cholesterol/gamma-HCH transport system substrate-binding protein
MPRTRSLAWAELKVGLITVFAIVMTALLIFVLSGQGGFPWQQYALKTVFGNIAGLKEGAPVRLAGLEVGSVESLRFMGDRVEVTMNVRKDMQPRITTRSVAALGSVSLLGESAVDITASVEGTPVAEWGYVPSGPSTGSLADVATRASGGIEELTGLLQEIRGGQGTLGQLVTNDSVYRELGGLLSAAEAVARNINDGRGTLGRLITNPSAAQSLEASMENLAAVTARIRAGEGSLGRLLAEDTLATSLTSTTTNLDAITGRMNRGEGTLGQLATNRELFDRLNSMTTRFDAVAESLQQGQGTAGQLLQDRQLYENMNAAVLELRTTAGEFGTTATEVRNLVMAIRADPKKYLNIKVSLF